MADGLVQCAGRLSERTGIDFSSHQLRKTFAATMYDADVPDEVVGDLLGHKGSVTRLYAPVGRRQRLEAIATLDYGVDQAPARPKVIPRESDEPTSATIALDRRSDQSSRSVEPVEAPVNARGILSRSLTSDAQYALDVDAGEWHALSGYYPDVGLAGGCGVELRQVDDRTAAGLLARRYPQGDEPSDRLERPGARWCDVCFTPKGRAWEHRPVLEEPPRRIARLIGIPHSRDGSDN